MVAPKFDENYGKKNKQKKKRAEEKKCVVDEENYIHYRPKDYHAEQA